MPLRFSTDASNAIDLHIISAEATENWLDQLPHAAAAWARASGFKGNVGQALSLPATGDLPALAAVGYGTAASRKRGRFALAAAAVKLPEGTYRIASGLPEDQAETESLGWLLSSYRFDRYKTLPPMKAQLLAPEGVNVQRVEAIANGEALTRALINTPASDMGPPDLEQAARDLAAQHTARIEVTVGDDLLAANLPMIHTVGRAADRAPRLIDMRWGDKGPTLTLVGKGVCFDTGGLNIKPAASMGLMKKDMGGAAAVLGLAHMIMATGMELQLRVLIPAVENSISNNAYRPQDVLTSR